MEQVVDDEFEVLLCGRFDEVVFKKELSLWEKDEIRIRGFELQMI